jgi:ribonucleoside-diphosphate reductase alpha chain
VEIPKAWSALATNVVASRYFRGTPGSPQREGSVRQMVKRVVDTITGWGKGGGYFASDADAETFRGRGLPPAAAPGHELQLAGLVQRGHRAPAPVLGLLQSTRWRTRWSPSRAGQDRGRALQVWLGHGQQLSTLRSSRETLAGGGTASGRSPFMRGFDAFAGVIKERRQDAPGGEDGHPQHRPPRHPGVRALQDQRGEEGPGRSSTPAYDGSFNGEAYSRSSSRTPNNSVRRQRRLHARVENDELWTTRAVLDGRADGRLRARDLFHEIALNAHVTGDPGMQFHDTVNAGTPAPTPTPSTPPTRAASTCSSTTRPATWRRST